MHNRCVVDRLMDAEECARVFGRLPFFSNLTNQDIAALVPLAVGRDFVAGTTIFYEDDEADAVYLISSGAVEVFKSDENGKKLPLIVLRDSGLLGEIGLLNNTPRTATARALTAVQTVCFRSGDFYQALNSGVVPAYRMVLAFARVLAQRLTVMDEKLFQLHQTHHRGADEIALDALRQRLITNYVV